MAAGLPRAVELALALAGLLALTPLLLMLAAAVKLSSPGPVLFRQKRVGRGGCPFTMLKLRTMRDDTGGPRITAAGDARVTAVGRFLRRAKLDELPALWNVVRGELALVGPRPEVPRYVDTGDPRWRRVLAARPGLTDPVTLRLRDEEGLLAAVDGDREVFYRERLLPWKLERQAAYLDRRTAWSDLGVIVQTLAAIVRPGRVEAPTLDEIASGSG